MTTRTLAALALLLGLVGCNETIDHHTVADASGREGGVRLEGGAEARADAGRDARGEAGEGGAPATLSIYIQGDTTPSTFSDGLAGQTPKEYAMGLGRFDLLRSPADPAPVVVFDHGSQPVEVDLLGLTLGGQARFADLPAGSYSHGRILLTMSRFKVAAQVHVGAMTVPGDISVVSALSDTTIEGKAWKQGETTFSFMTYTLPAVLPLLPTTGGGTVVQMNGQTWLVFAFPTPITIGPSAKDRKATIVYKVFESFRWQDETKPGYFQQQLDVDALGLSYEPVKSFGATGYGVDLQ